MYKYCLKRIFDLIGSFVLLPIVGIAFLIVGPLIYIEDHGTILYRARRRGKNGKVFEMYKFRTMKMNAPDIRNEDGSTYNGKNDPRVTKIGKILRELSIDELPQILNVLKGDMSFIGPRPNNVRKTYEELERPKKKRLKVRPGITGYSQAFYRNSVSSEEKLKNDCYYVDHVSLWLDIRIIIQTIKSVIARKNIYNE